jgi:hypothetical protein
VLYSARPSEVSFVDSPCLPAAHFAYVKTDGSTELRKFKPSEAKEPIMAKNKAAVTLKDAVKAYILAEVAKRVSGDGVEKDLYGVSVFAQILQAIASLQWSSEYEEAYEEDDSTVPAQLMEDLKSLIETFVAMAQEEANELVAAKKAAGAADEFLNSPDDLSKGAKTMSAHMKKCAAFHKSMSGAHADRADKCEDAAKSFHTKCAKAHGKMADHCSAMAEQESDDASTKAAAVETTKEQVPMTEEKKEAAAAGTETTVEPKEIEKAAATGVSESGKLTKAIENQIVKSLENLDKNPKLNDFVEKAVADTIERILMTKINPDGVKLAGHQLVPRAGEKLVEKSVQTGDPTAIVL